MKRNILIILSIICAAVLLRFVFGHVGQFIAAKMKRNKPAPVVTVQEIDETESAG